MPHFLAILGDPVSGWGVSENEASLAAIRAQKEGLPDGRRAGRDFPRIFRKSWTNHWGLTVSYFWSLIKANHASFSGQFGWPGIGAGMDPAMRDP